MSPARYYRPELLGAVPAVETVSVPRNQVIIGDCVTAMSVLPDACVDFILTDPPYVCRYQDRAGRRVANDDNADWILPSAREMYRVLKDESFAVSFYGWNAVDVFMQAWKIAGFQVSEHLVFVKPYASSERRFEHRHEMAYVLTKGRPSRHVTHGESDVREWRYTGNLHHPTEKPVSALWPLIDHLCPKDGLVLDPFCGSGSTLLAAREVHRDYLGIELAVEHFLTAKRRLGQT